MRTICLDLDGVVKRYYGEPFDVGGDFLPGALDAIHAMQNAGFSVVVCTCRDTGSREYWKSRLADEGLTIEVVNNKPISAVYIDDRGFRFTGSWSKETLDGIFKVIADGTWWQAGSGKTSQNNPT